MILGDRDLKYYLERKYIVIEPLFQDSIRENGVDLRVGREIARLKRTQAVFEMGGNNQDFYEVEKGEDFVISPHEHALLVTEEYVKLPNDVMAFVNLRSTFARAGLFIPPTIVDAGFEGQLTIEVMGSEFPVRLRAGTRFIHLIFAKTLTPVEKPYSSNYQGQRGVTLPKLGHS